MIKRFHRGLRTIVAGYHHDKEVVSHSADSVCYTCRSVHAGRLFLPNELRNPTKHRVSRNTALTTVKKRGET